MHHLSDVLLSKYVRGGALCGRSEAPLFAQCIVLLSKYVRGGPLLGLLEIPSSAQYIVFF